MPLAWTTIGYGVCGGLTSLVVPRILLCCTCCGLRRFSYSFVQSDAGEAATGSRPTLCQEIKNPNFSWFFNLLVFVIGFALTTYIVHQYSTAGSNPNPGNFTIDENFTTTTVSVLFNTTLLP
ncbi:hypothetical protein CDAR_604001 [Caerostris darwini]|uniref:Transmembrane protein n=1 Tax=Caerostris darwini TaxID=1538125 RepID=A0AAV4RYC2_9ARAC|nr:hypothetical protein CDAR_604001 [Caerostris darwini]